MARQFGSGDHVYKLAEGWGQPLPEGYTYRDAVNVAVDRQDRVYMFNRGPHPVIVYDRDGRFLRSWGEGLFVRPHGITIGRDDAIFCVDDVNHCIHKLTLDGTLLMTLGTPGQPADSGWAGSYDNLPGGPPFNEPTNIAVAPDGSLYVSDGYRNCKVHHFTADGQFLHSWGSAGRGSGEFRLVHGVEVGADGSVYIADRSNDRIQVFSPDGDYLAEWEARQPNTAHLGPDGFVYSAEMGFPTATTDGSLGSRVAVRDSRGAIVSSWGDIGHAEEPGNLAAAHGVTVDSRGDVYVAEVSYSGRGANGQVSANCHIFQKYLRVR